MRRPTYIIDVPVMSRHAGSRKRNQLNCGRGAVVHERGSTGSPRSRARKRAPK